MLRHMLIGKLHRARVTEANLNYVGSITIDEDLMDAAGILPGERVQVVNNHNGARLETYVIPGPRGQGDICLNGAAARWAQPGDVVIIMAYGWMDEQEAARHRPKVVVLDEENRVLGRIAEEAGGEIPVKFG
ncbi:aspartate 1-decarboxylase [Kyrpidia spormannii]|uniref:Aspartate 1-decarboxylase n=1 Tax=Kyrpidia spormannii TaxID=2055160 RepID=A0A2K8N8D4_9BACL|nr:aspartate 1-decarboxylase [Kyrpidia spormannii]ATY84870.1 aspartate 1-decarboxylase [Kyrpidia spormannii]